MLSSSSIADELWKYSTDKIIELPIEIERILRKTGENNELIILEKVEVLLSQVKRLIKKKIQEYDERGTTPNFRFSNLSENRLIGCVISEKEESVKNKLAYKRHFYQLINELEWKAFENLSLFVMQLYNFQKCDLGKRTKDGGLDFYGFYVPYTEEKYTGFLSKMNIRIFGQAKHRNKQTISEGEIRKFYTFYKDFLSEKGRAYKFVSSKSQWFLKTKGPLIPLFFTNSNFSKDALTYANGKGVVTRDGEQIVEDIIRLSKNEPWFRFREGKMSFKPEVFKRFLAEFPH
jgi:hypothetical protein